MWKIIWMFRQCLCQGPLALAQSACSSECEFLDCSLYFQKRVTGYIYFDSAFFSLNIYVFLLLSLCVHVNLLLHRHKRKMWSNQSSPSTMWVRWFELRILQLDWKHCHMLNWLTSLEYSFLICTVFFFYFLCNNFWKLLIHVIKTSLAMWLFKIV